MLLTLLFACEREVSEHPLPVFDGAALDHAVVWNGFDQAWGYNHRLNAFGDYVGPVECDGDDCHAELVHSAASGSGSDTARWTTRHTRVHAPGASFVQGATRFSVEGTEGETQRLLAREPFPLDGAAGTVVLAGWDVWATGDAERLRALAVGVGEVEDGAFDVQLTFGTDCDSVECDGGDPGDTSVRYEVVVAWLAVAGDDLSVTAAEVAKDYAWEADGLPDELSLDALGVAGTLKDRAAGAGASALAFRSVYVELDDDHHLAEWASRVVPGEGEAFTATLGFKQWNEGTYWNPVSYVEPGEASVAADVVRLSFAEGCAEPASVSGELRWRANGRAAGADAVDVRDVWFGGCS
ncbi:MAG: hypothetical protein ACOZNI_21350 [Myxococcota bacterium]